MNPLKNCIMLSCSIKIYVPSTIDVSIASDNSEYVDKTLEFLSELFGGATTSKAFGAWLSNDLKLVKEKIDLVFSYCDQTALDFHIDKIYNYCMGLKYMLKQEAIALEVNNILYFV
jgi:hypothetical protein